MCTESHVVKHTRHVWLIRNVWAQCDQFVQHISADLIHSRAKYSLTKLQACTEFRNLIFAKKPDHKNSTRCFPWKLIDSTSPGGDLQEDADVETIGCSTNLHERPDCVLLTRQALAIAEGSGCTG